MILVEPVQLDLEIPSEQVRMVLMQPYIHFAKPSAEPYQWDTNRVNEQLAAIQRTMDVAQGQ